MKHWKRNLFLPNSEGNAENSSTAEYEAYLLDWDQEMIRKRRPAVIICPGGGYGHLSCREGEPVAMKFLSMGYHAFVLSYSLAPVRFPTSLQELAMLVFEIRSHAEEWGIDKEKIVVSGFSAGGHLACSLGAFWNREFVYGPLGVNAEDIRPNGMILCYPVVTSGLYCHSGSFQNLLGDETGNEELRNLVSLEHQVGSHTPKTFLWHTVTDQSVPIYNSLLLAEALVKHQVNLEFHMYPIGGHGLALATEETSNGQEKYIVPQCQSWIYLADIWLRDL